MRKRLDGNEMEESRDLDTRRWKATDNEGHVPGTNQAEFNEQRAQEREANDDSELNQLDDREEAGGNL